MTTANTNANACTNAAEATMNFKNLTAPARQMHMLDKPSGMYSHIAKRNLDHQMRWL